MAAASASIIMGMQAAGGAYSQSQAQKAQGAYQRQIAETNARIASQRADAAVEQGEDLARKVRKDAQKVAASQRAAAAAQGISSTEGDVADLITETEVVSAEDAATARINAWRAANGFKTEALNATMQGQFAEAAANQSANNTVLTGGMQALGYGLDAQAKSGAAKKAKSK